MAKTFAKTMIPKPSTEEIQVMPAQTASEASLADAIQRIQAQQQNLFVI